MISKHINYVHTSLDHINHDKSDAVDENIHLRRFLAVSSTGNSPLFRDFCCENKLSQELRFAIENDMKVRVQILKPFSTAKPPHSRTGWIIYKYVYKHTKCTCQNTELWDHTIGEYYKYFDPGDLNYVYN